MLLKEEKILATKSSPEIILKPEGFIRIRGRSMKGYETNHLVQAEDWVDIYVCDPPDLTCVDIYLEYFNGINFKQYISFLRKIESVKLKNKSYIINWYFEEGDEDILEKGEYISFLLNMPFNFIRINNSLTGQAEQFVQKKTINTTPASLMH